MGVYTTCAAVWDRVGSYYALAALPTQARVCVLEPQYRIAISAAAAAAVSLERGPPRLSGPRVSRGGGPPSNPYERACPLDSPTLPHGSAGGGFPHLRLLEGGTLVDAYPP